MPDASRLTAGLPFHPSRKIRFRRETGFVMTPPVLLEAAPEVSEWRHCGPFLLLAIGVHVLVLLVPLRSVDGKPVDVAAMPITARLVEQAPVIPEVRQPAPEPTAQTARRERSTPTPRPVLAVPARAVVAPVAFAVSPQIAVPALAAEDLAGASTASAAVTVARFDANYLHNPRPAYPPLSRRLGEEGKVLLRVRVSKEGLADAVNLEKSSNFERLDEAARAVVARWRFVPARRGDEAIEATVIVPIVFRLES